jgi:hypothetical protein
MNKPALVALATLACVIALASTQATAADFYCSSTRSLQLALAELEAESSAAAMGVDGKNKPARRRFKVERFDLLQAYSGQPVLVGSTWLTACMMDPTHPDTRAAFSGLIGLNPEASASMARSTGLVDRGIRITRDMPACLKDNAPAVGYSAIPIASPNVKPCF